MTTSLPPLNFRHLVEMTSHLGMFQHAVHNVPNNSEGYCADDNARAYLLTVLVEGLGSGGIGQAAFCSKAGTYLAFLWDAFEPRTRRFRNFMSRGLEWMELEGSDDSHARAMWAVGTGVSQSQDVGHRSVCGMLFHRGMEQLGKVRSPRAWAFGLLGLNAYLRSCPGDQEALKLRNQLVEALMDLYKRNAKEDWRWFEQVVSYDNARIPQALIQSGFSMGCVQTLAAGLDSLEWLVEVQTAEGGWFSPIGCHGFWKNGGDRAQFDQQSLEASAMVSACLQAEAATSDPMWTEHATKCMAWYTGYNDLGIELYDRVTGGCHDALLADHINENQGAESTIACHLALVEMMLAREQNKAKEELCKV